MGNTSKRYEVLAKEINKGVKVDEKGGQKILGWSPNNVKRLIVGPDGAMVQYHCAPAHSKYNRKIEIIRFNEEWLREDEENARQGKYKSILRVLTEGRVCSCIEEILILGESASIVSKIDMDISSIMGGKGVGALENRFPRLDSIMVANIGFNSFMQYMGDDIRRMSSPECRYDLMQDVIKGKIENRKIYKKQGSPWWKGSYLRANIYNIDSENGPIYNVFEDVRNYYEKREREKKLYDTYEKDIRKVLEGDNLRIAVEQLYDAHIRINEIMSKASMEDKVSWLYQLDDTHIEKAIKNVMGDKQIECYNLIKAVEDIERYAKQVSTSRIKVISMRLSKWGIKWGKKEIGIDKRAENIKNFIEIIIRVVNAIICCEYATLASFVLYGGSESKNESNAKVVQQYAQDIHGGKLCYCNIDKKYCKIAVNGAYEKYMKTFTEDNSATGHLQSGQDMFRIIDALL